MIDDRRSRKARIRAAQPRRHVRMAHRHAAHVAFVDDGVVPGDTRRAVIAPGEGGIDHATLRGAWCAVAPVERQVRFRVPGAVAEVRVAPHQGTLQVLGVRLDQQLVGIEAMAALRIVGSVHAITVQQAGTRLGQIRVPVGVGALANVNALSLVPAAGIEQAQLDLRGVRGEQREIYALAIPGGTARVGLTGPNCADQGIRLRARRAFTARAALPVGCNIHVREPPCRIDTSQLG